MLKTDLKFEFYDPAAHFLVTHTSGFAFFCHFNFFFLATGLIPNIAHLHKHLTDFQILIEINETRPYTGQHQLRAGGQGQYSSWAGAVTQN